jgi:hypothetical protein
MFCECRGFVCPPWPHVVDAFRQFLIELLLGIVSVGQLSKNMGKGDKGNLVGIDNSASAEKVIDEGLNLVVRINL